LRTRSLGRRHARCRGPRDVAARAASGRSAAARRRCRPRRRCQPRDAAGARASRGLVLGAPAARAASRRPARSVHAAHPTTMRTKSLLLVACCLTAAPAQKLPLSDGSGRLLQLLDVGLLLNALDPDEPRRDEPKHLDALELAPERPQ